MKRTAPALVLLALWLVSLALFTAFASRRLSVGTDLRLFLPSPTTANERLLLEVIGEGPASRVLVIALGGGSPERLADVSRALVSELRDSELFRFIANGESFFDEFPDELLPYRFLLAPTLDTHRFDRDFLKSELEARARDLASPAGLLVEPLLARDPTLELLDVLELWEPIDGPRRYLDVWFDAEGRRALLLAETSAPAFDPEAQRAALAELESAHAAADGGADTTMTVTGAGAFTVAMEARTRAEAQSLARFATIGLIALLLLSYRSIGSVVLSVLPLASAALAGLAAVSALFGTVHGITLAFGFTLIGVAQDYPIHLLSHRRPDLAPSEVARRLWPTLATGVASTCIAYLTFLFAGVRGLAQLGTFTVTGLIVAALTTRFVLPLLLEQKCRDRADSRALARIWAAIPHLPHGRWAAVATIGVAAALIALGPQPFWEDDLNTLTPVPAQLLAQDEELRAQIGTADLRYLLVIEAPDTEQALLQLEMLDPELQALVDRGAIAGYDHAARYLPPVATQQARQTRLPDLATLRNDLAAALAATPFRLDAFNPFLEDVARARTLDPLTLEAAGATPLSTRLELLLREDGSSATALVTFSGVLDPPALRALAASSGSSTLIDVKQESDGLITRQRTKILASLAVASLLLVLVVAFALRSSRPSISGSRTDGAFDHRYDCSAASVRNLAEPIPSDLSYLGRRSWPRLRAILRARRRRRGRAAPHAPRHTGLRAVDVLGFHAACDFDAARAAGDRDAGRDRRRGQLRAEPAADET